MTDFKFKPEIFGSADNYLAKDMADKAQAAQDEYLKTCLKVYGYKESDGHWYVKLFRTDQDTHEAYLFNLKPIEKPHCEHEPTWSDGPNKSIVYFGKCKKCGIKLKAKWEAVK